MDVSSEFGLKHSGDGDHTVDDNLANDAIESGPTGLWVGNVDPMVKDNVLRQVFGQFGPLLKSYIRKGKTGLTFALVFYDNTESPLNAKNTLEDKEIKDISIKNTKLIMKLQLYNPRNNTSMGQNISAYTPTVNRDANKPVNRTNTSEVIAFRSTLITKKDKLQNKLTACWKQLNMVSFNIVAAVIADSKKSDQIDFHYLHESEAKYVLPIILKKKIKKFRKSRDLRKEITIITGYGKEDPDIPDKKDPILKFIVEKYLMENNIEFEMKKGHFIVILSK